MKIVEIFNLTKNIQDSYNQIIEFDCKCWGINDWEEEYEDGVWSEIIVTIGNCSDDNDDFELSILIPKFLQEGYKYKVSRYKHQLSVDFYREIMYGSDVGVKLDAELYEL